MKLAKVYFDKDSQYILKDELKVTDIKLFVCCHLPSYVPSHPLLFPIQVGATLSDIHFSGYLHDDSGENISQKNLSYCELTAQYWAWKNINIDYYGFFHYRRYLFPNTFVKRPIFVEVKPTLSILEKLRYDTFVEFIEKYDLIAPMGENMHVSVRQHYISAPYHHKRDLQLIEEIIKEKFPEYSEAMDLYLENSVCYFGNIFIMRRQVFYSYCSWLFTILEAFDRMKDDSTYGVQEKRVDGYLAERLFGVYITYQKTINELSIIEVPRVHFAGKITSYVNRRTIDAILPPGTRRKAIIKRIKKKLC